MLLFEHSTVFVDNSIEKTHVPPLSVVTNRFIHFNGHRQTSQLKAACSCQVSLPGTSKTQMFIVTCNNYDCVYCITVCKHKI